MSRRGVLLPAALLVAMATPSVAGAATTGPGAWIAEYAATVRVAQDSSWVLDGPPEPGACGERRRGTGSTTVRSSTSPPVALHVVGGGTLARPRPVTVVPFVTFDASLAKTGRIDYERPPGCGTRAPDAPPCGSANFPLSVRLGGFAPGDPGDPRLLRVSPLTGLGAQIVPCPDPSFVGLAAGTALLPAAAFGPRARRTATVLMRTTAIDVPLPGGGRASLDATTTVRFTRRRTAPSLDVGPAPQRLRPDRRGRMVVRVRCPRGTRDCVGSLAVHRVRGFAPGALPPSTTTTLYPGAATGDLIGERLGRAALRLRPARRATLRIPLTGGARRADRLPVILVVSLRDGTGRRLAYAAGDGRIEG